MKTVKSLSQNQLHNPVFSAKMLKKVGITCPEKEAELLFALAAQKPMEYMYAHPEYRASLSEQRRFDSFIRRRCSREPVAYIANQKDFYGNTFFVNKHVLIPRPETEQLVSLSCEAWKKLQTKTPPIDIIDVGTGSGAIILSLAKVVLASGNTRRTDRFFATESSQRALAVAQQNAKRLGVEQRVTFLRGNLLKPYLDQGQLSQYQLILANLPYLTTAEMRKLQPEVRYEPKKALDGGKDGLDVYRTFFHQIVQAHIRFTAICEIAPQQKKPLSRIIRAIFPSADTKCYKDLTGRTRFIQVTAELF